MGTSAGIAIAAYGASRKASAEKSAGKSQQAVAEYNAQVSDLQADDALARGMQDETRQRLKARGLAGSTRVAYAAAGIDISDADSTFADVQANAATLSEIDALTIRTNAAREAWGYRTQATNQRAGGQIAMVAANNRAIGALVSGASSIYGATYRPGNKLGVTAPAQG